MGHPSQAGYLPGLLNHSWCTPEWILKICREALGVEQFDLDPCSNPTSVVNAKTEFRLPERNGLLESWDEYDTIFVNPPYGVAHVHKTTLLEYEGVWSECPEKDEYYTSSIDQWIDKCAATSSRIIALIPVTPETRAWRESIWDRATAICFLNKRAKFIDPKTGELCTQGFPKPQALIYWGPISGYLLFKESTSKIGTTIPCGVLLAVMEAQYGEQENEATESRGMV